MGILVVYQLPCSTHLYPVNPAIDTEKILNNSHLTYMVYEKCSSTITFSLPKIFFFFFHKQEQVIIVIKTIPKPEVELLNE